MKSKRSFVSLLTALSFLVLAVTGILAFVRPFSMRIAGLHALIGFVFVGLVGLHVLNNRDHLNRYFRSKALWVTAGIVSGLAALFLWQPAPVRAILGLSNNLGPALDRFEVTSDGLTYRYTLAPDYRIVLTAMAGKAFDPADSMLPADPENPMPYRLLIEIDQPDDKQPSLVYGVEIDNTDPRTFQLLELVGSPKREEDDEAGAEVWALYYIDERLHSALGLIDSALLTIGRGDQPVRRP